MGDIETAVEIGIDHPPPDGIVHRVHESIGRDAGIVDEDVDGAEVAVRLLAASLFARKLTATR